MALGVLLVATAVAAVVVGLGWSADRAAAQQPLQTCVEEFGLTEGTQTFEVPAGVTEVTIDAWGAQGGDFSGGGFTAPTPGGRGGAVLGTTVAVTPGDQIEMLVGGAGQDVDDANNPGGVGGFNGGGDGGNGQAHQGGGGGGASTVSHNSSVLVIAGGGGGAAHTSDADPGAGGDGGLNGEDGTGSTEAGNAQPGQGATTTAGGAGGAGDGVLGTSGAPGTAGQGGDGGNGGFPSTTASDGGGGGGGGLFGGGGGGGGDFSTGSGATAGGGSSMGQPTSDFETGVKEGDGHVTLTYQAESCGQWPCDSAAYTTAFGGEVGNQTEFARMDRQPDGTYTRTVLATVAGEQLNGLGFRTQDGFMYAWNNQAQRIVRIGDNQDGTASIRPLPPVVGLPQFGAFVGTFLEDGTYFLFGTPTNPTGFIIDVSGPVPTVLSAVTPSFDASANGTPLGDIAVSPVDGNLYAVADGEVHLFTLTGSAPNMQLNLGPVLWDGPGDPTGSPGAQWFEPRGAAGTLLYPRPDGLGAPGGLYAQDMATGAFTRVGSFPEIPNGDGASCPNGIAVTKDASPRTVTAGGELTYSYTITARGLVDNPVDFVDTLPAGMTYVPGGVTVNGTFGPTNAYGGTDTLSISGTIPRNTTVTITARVAVAATAPCNVNVPNQAQATMHAAGLPDVTIVSDDPTTPTDPDDATNVRVNCPPPPPPGCEPNCPPSADVTINKTVSDRRVRVGEMVTYRAVARNNGPGVATNVKVDDRVPSRLDARSARSTQGNCSVRRNRVHCELGTMAVGQEVTIEVRARAIRSGRATNSASVDSDSCTKHPCDDDPARVVIVEPKLKLTKSVGKRVLRAGQTTSYTIRVSNPSDVRLRNVRTCDRLPAGLVFVSAKPKAKLSKGQHCWTLKRLGAGKGKTYRVTVRALRGTSGRRVNRATATSPDAKRARAKRAVRVIGGGLRPDVVTG